MLARWTFNLAPFDNATVSAGYYTAATGAYRVRGVIENVTPSDANLANNGRTWTLTTSSPPDIQASKAGLEFGTVKVGEFPLTGNGLGVNTVRARGWSTLP